MKLVASITNPEHAMKSLAAFLAACGLLVAAPLAAQTAAEHDAHHADPGAAAAAAALPLSDGEVRKIDKSTGKLTIKHGPLQNLQMPPMTMVFRVQEPAMLDQIKEGDKIKFSADRVDGALTVTRVQVVR